MVEVYGLCSQQSSPHDFNPKPEPPHWHGPEPDFATYPGGGFPFDSTIGHVPSKQCADEDGCHEQKLLPPVFCALLHECSDDSLLQSPSKPA